jgi:phosphatidylglycerol:prolipoprotein diacylglycerol transferase
MHSILFKIGPITLYSYGFMLMVAFIVGTALAAREARRKGLDGDAILDMAPWVLIASIVGARLIFVAQNWAEFSANPSEVFKVWTGGLTFYGGLAGALLAGVWCAWRRRLPFWRFADAVAPSVALGYAIGRVGCFLNGCCYGSPTDLPWACRFPDATLLGGLTPPSHPVQLYAAVVNLGIFAVLYWLNQRAVVPGQVFLSFLMLYSLYRFGAEFLRRGATAEVVAGGITSGQLVSLAVAIGALLGLVLSRSRPRVDTPVLEEKLAVGSKRSARSRR